MWANHFGALPNRVLHNNIGVPNEIVVTQHAALRVTSRATCVDQAAGLAWLLNRHLCMDDLVLDSLSHLKEVFPKEEARPGNISRQGVFAPDDESLNAIILVEINGEAFEVFRIFDDDDFRVSVFSLVKACVGLVCDVDTSNDLVIHDTSHEGHGPLR